MMNGFDFLVDFVNVQEWSRKSFLDLIRKYQVTGTIKGQKQGHDVFYLAKEDGKLFFVEPEKNQQMIASLTPEFIATEEDFFNDVARLQGQWRALIIRTSRDGPDLDFLNSISARVAQWEIAPTGNKFKPHVEAFSFHYGDLETTLGFMYLDAVLLKGEAFTRLAVCRQCGKVFMFKRKSAKFCPGRECRDQFHNQRKIESGYLARHQARKRAEGNLKYIR